jgi:hypothetical protein
MALQAADGGIDMITLTFVICQLVKRWREERRNKRKLIILPEQSRKLNR